MSPPSSTPPLSLAYCQVSLPGRHIYGSGSGKHYASNAVLGTQNLRCNASCHSPVIGQVFEAQHNVATDMLQTQITAVASQLLIDHAICQHDNLHALQLQLTITGKPAVVTEDSRHRCYPAKGVLNLFLLYISQRTIQFCCHRPCTTSMSQHTC